MMKRCRMKIQDIVKYTSACFLKAFLALSPNCRPELNSFYHKLIMQVIAFPKTIVTSSFDWNVQNKTSGNIQQF